MSSFLFETARHKRLTSITLRLLAGTAFAVIAAGPAAAQQAAETAPSAAEASAPPTAAAEALIDGDIIVTAQRRQESIQSVPIAITAISGETIEKANVRGIEDYFAKAPNVSFVSNGSRDRKDLSIRGVSNQLDPASDVRPAAYAFYIDDFSVVAGTSNPEVVDLERIEVLRGPQGTYFGRNSVGGAINVSTRKPTDEWYGQIDLGYSSFDTKRIAAIVNVPISESFAIRAAGQIESSDGYIKNINPIGGGNNSNYKTGRIIARYKPTENFTSDTTFSYSDETTGMRAGVPTGALTATWRSVYYANAQGNVADPNGVGFFPANRNRVNFNRPQEVGNKFWYISNRSVYEFDTVSLTAVAGYLKADTFNYGDVDGASFDFFYEDNLLKRNSVSGELRLQSIGASRFEWSIGANIGRDTGSTDQSTFYGLDNKQNRPAGLEISGIDSTAVNKYQAVFAQGTYHFTDELSAVVGGRFTHETVDRTYIRRSNAAVTDNVDRGKGFSDFSPRFTLNYKPANNVLAYATISRGFKSGGVQIAQLSLQQSYKPETLLNYEGGLKFDMFNRRLRVDLSGFYMDWKNVQQAVRFQFLNAAGTLINVNGIDNAAKATSYGLDGSIGLRVTRAFTINAHGGWLHATFDSYPTALVDGVNVNATGKRLINAPKWTVGGDAEYRVPLSSTFEGFLIGEWNYRSKTNSSILALRYTTYPFISPGYHNVNLRAGVENETVRLGIYVQNAFNANYYNNVYEKAFYSGVQVEPSFRSFGVNLTYKFKP